MSHAAGTVFISMEGFLCKTSGLSLCEPGRGEAIRVWGGGEGKVPDFDANDGKFHGMPGAILLRDVEPFPYPA